MKLTTYEIKNVLEAISEIDELLDNKYVRVAGTLAFTYDNVTVKARWSFSPEDEVSGVVVTEVK